MHFIYFVGSQAVLKETPCNVTAEVGRTVTFRCAADSKLSQPLKTSVCWKYKENWTSRDEFFVHNGVFGNDTFSRLHNVTFNITEEANTMMLNYVNFNNAGVFVCYECKQVTTTKGTAVELLVFGEFLSDGTAK